MIIFYITYHDFSIKDVLVGLFAVFIINMASLFSAIILPLRKRHAFKWLLTTFIGLGKQFRY